MVTQGWWQNWPGRNQLIAVLAAGVLTACGGGGGGTTAPQQPTAPTPTPTPQTVFSDAFDTRTSTARFLTQSTFGPTKDQLDTLPGTSPSQWIQNEFAKPATLFSPIISQYQTLYTLSDESFFFNANTPTFAFWRNSIGADDQLRQRVAFALSEILVVSSFSSDLLQAVPEAIGYYQDILVQNAFGNYRDLLEQVTYSPAMGHFLTYEGNKKADPTTGQMPDENYAREIMQLFSIGLVELNNDGSVVIGGDGQPVETYDNSDITGLAKVFTGLALDYSRANGDDFSEVGNAPMVINEADHSMAEKAFLTLTIPQNTPAAQSIDLALDEIMAHPNVAPFISRQLIQRLVTSDPEPDYVSRVSDAFNTGRYTLPNGDIVGDGRKGDLQATIAAILFDPDARDGGPVTANRFGKIREPIIRFTNWARAFDVSPSTPELIFQLYDTGEPTALSQHAYRARSVFNFFRPGYIAPGTETGAAGMTVPELQIVNASSVPGYANFMTLFVSEFFADTDNSDLQAFFDASGVALNASNISSAFRPDYTDEFALAATPEALVDHLDELLTFGTLSDETRAAILDIFSVLTGTTNEDIALKTRAAILMILTSPDFAVQE